MEWILKEGKLNENTYLIDSLINGEKMSMACYLIKGTKKTALVDSSGPENASTIINKLQNMNLIPNILILTHSHWDHAGGTNIFQDQLKDLVVVAGQPALKSLKNNKTFNEPFSPFSEDLKSIEGIKAVKEGDKIDLGGLNLKIFETPGHTDCSISILDEKNGNLIIGDAPGYIWTKQLIMPPIMPPEFSEKKFFSSIEKIKNLDYKSLCLAHFGLLKRQFALNFPDRAKSSYIQWRDFFISKWGEYQNELEVVKSFITQLNSVGIFDIGGKISHKMIGNWIIKGLKSDGLI